MKASFAASNVAARAVVSVIESEGFLVKLVAASAKSIASVVMQPERFQIEEAAYNCNGRDSGLWR